LGKNVRKPQGGIFFDSHCIYCVQYTASLHQLLTCTVIDWRSHRLTYLSLWHIWKFLEKVICTRNFRKKIRKLAQVTCKSSTWHTCKLNNERCRLKVAFRGRYCVVILTGQSQLTVCERKLPGIELVLFLKVDFRKYKLAQMCQPHMKVFFGKWLSKENFQMCHRL